MKPMAVVFLLIFLACEQTTSFTPEYYVKTFFAKKMVCENTLVLPYSGCKGVLSILLTDLKNKKLRPSNCIIIGTNQLQERNLVPQDEQIFIDEVGEKRMAQYNIMGPILLINKHGTLSIEEIKPDNLPEIRTLLFEKE